MKISLHLMTAARHRAQAAAAISLRDDSGANLKGMQDKLNEVLEETVRVREELGHPISATPFSQLIGIQSVLNVVTGARWSTVPAEDLATMRAAGPLNRGYDYLDDTTIKDLLDHLMSLKRPRHVHVQRPEGAFTLSRGSECGMP